MAKSMKWVVAGLGNPGAEYEWTRHNVGRKLVCQLIQKQPADRRIQFLIPDTYMNRSGLAVAPLVKTAATEKLVVIRDDLDLPLGRVKMAFNRGAGGHKGVESVKRAVKTEAFIQIKVGISPVTTTGKIKKPQGEEKVQKFILSDFKPAEKQVLKKVFKKVSTGLELLVTAGREAAMNFLNTR